MNARKAHHIWIEQCEAGGAAKSRPMLSVVRTITE
jgi:hypothetical protein